MLRMTPSITSVIMAACGENLIFFATHVLKVIGSYDFELGVEQTFLAVGV